MPYSIRLVNHTDPKTRKLLCALQTSCLPGDTVYETTNGWWYVAYDENMVPVGFAGVVPSLRWGDCGYLCRAGVLPSHRGHGLQKKLIRARVKKARQLGWNWLVTDTYENPASSNSLISTGFKLFDPTKPWGANKTLYWRLKL
jgi:GNAT superfamily N-acetyltransferase